MVPRGDVWWVWSLSGSRYVPTADLWYRGTPEIHDQKFIQYTATDLFDIGPADVVVDVGAFIGEFTIPAAKHADTIVAIEPTPSSYEFLSRNTASIANVITVQALLNDTPRRVRFNISDNPTESSIFEVDNGTATAKNLPANRLDNLLQEMGYKSIDFLKLEAEGSEPEILTGCSEISIQHIAVDAGPERNGATTVQEVTEILESRGYEVQVIDNTVFGTRQ